MLSELTAVLLTLRIVRRAALAGSAGGAPQRYLILLLGGRLR
jgi:hypothetical protein